MKEVIRIFFVLLCILILGCDGNKLSPTGPSALEPGSPTAKQLLQTWSPYIGIHTSGEAFDVYKEIVPILMSRGTLRGVRLGIDAGGDINYVSKMIVSLGVEPLYLIDNHFLFDPNIEARMDEIFRDYPEARYFQIGNEITTILPKTGPTMTIEEYMTVLKRIYRHVQSKHPGRAILLTQATFGAGDYGSRELQRMVDLGLAEMSPDKLVIGVNVYDFSSTGHAMNQYSSVFNILNGPLRNYRVWITETGSADSDLHISYVLNNYPKLRHYFRPEKIFWYAMWGGDNPPDVGFGLIRYPGRFPDYWKSPMYKILSGTE